MDKYYEWFKALHIICMTAWMAGLFYLPRLFANHTTVIDNKQMYNKFLQMEKKLYRIIMMPAMILTILFGSLLMHIYGFLSLGIWFHIKLTFVFLLVIQHIFWAKCGRDFAKHKNTKSSFFYKAMGELTTVFFIFIVILVVIKPFED